MFTVPRNHCSFGRDCRDDRQLANSGNAKVRLILACVAVLCLLTFGSSIASAQLTILADSVSDFSDEQGGNNWYYGYYISPFTYDTFQLMTQFLPDYYGREAWLVANGRYWTALFDDGAHPNGRVTSGGRQPVEQWAVRRWVSSVTGEISLAGTLAKRNVNSASNGVVGHILLNGDEIWSQYIAGTDSQGVDYDLTVCVNAGDVIDFALDPFGSNDWADGSYFTATVYTLDCSQLEPAIRPFESLNLSSWPGG